MDVHKQAQLPRFENHRAAMAHPAKLHHAPPIGQVHHEAKVDSRVVGQEETVTKIQAAVNRYLQLHAILEPETKEAAKETKDRHAAAKQEHIHHRHLPLHHQHPHRRHLPHQVLHLNAVIQEVVVTQVTADLVVEIHAAADSQ